MLTFKVLSALLAYPEPALVTEADRLIAVLEQEALLPPEHRQAIARFIDGLAGMAPLDAEERYVALFDRNRSLSLHLYEHVHGESRDRGQAMVQLAELYRLHGVEIDARELPDYLPLFLEFLSMLPLPAASSLLSEAVHVVAALTKRLTERSSPYAAVTAAVAALAARPAERAAVADVLEMLKPEADSLESLDRQWEEEAVRFSAAGGPDRAAVAASCGR
ncbi:nitrate reductase molybdenum cofactor assembly chaperone NarJ [Aliidongia dinghuensis]|uniref:Nitrate reductase molybdenum cofactor assembly chaperone NarJ n=1 Tax=Aliidongia dinghuensis TaxID=1867774 RepID=A0A8J2YZK9_9PROT|nr:nitrate reductase molybdenum cofactor assembly chaperone [Aliidongia dinghuensis]GGF43430.1 nitrate reductase molybdenum cofactor assembly chaperone NarJ [Aliidongia dinghuensis]